MKRISLLAALSLGVAAYTPGYQREWGNDAAETVLVHDIYEDGNPLMLVQTTDVAGYLTFVNATNPAAQVQNCTSIQKDQACRGSGQLVLQRLDGRGNTKWSRGLGGQDDITGVSVATDDKDRAYILLSTSAVAPRKRQTKQTPLLIRIDQTGALDPTFSVDIAGDAKSVTHATKVAFNRKDGDVYVTGYTNSKVSQDNCKENNGGFDTFVCRIDPTASKLKWCSFVGTTGDESNTPGATSIAFDARGNSYITGTTTGAFTGFTNAGGQDVYAAALDANGNIIWTTQWGGGADDQGVALAVDTYSNYLFVGGNTDGDLDGQGAHGSQDWFQSQLTQDTGNTTWTKLIGNTGTDVLTDMTIFRQRLFVTGHSNGPNYVSYWTDHVNKAPHDNNGTVRLYYQADHYGGYDFFQCETVNLFDGTFDWTGSPTGIPKWCSNFGSRGDDFASTVRVDKEYNITNVGNVHAGIFDTVRFTPSAYYGGDSDAALQQYYEYDIPPWYNPPEKNDAAPAKPLVCKSPSAVVKPIAVTPNATADSNPIQATRIPVAVKPVSGSSFVKVSSVLIGALLLLL